MTKITVYFNNGEEQIFEASGYDVLSCGLLSIRTEQAASKNSLIASVSKENTVGIPLVAIKYFEAEG